MTSRIMYIESRAGGVIGKARIGRVTFSRTGKTLYYGDRKFQSLEGGGLPANYYDLETREEYWITDCSKEGEPAPAEIDEDVREEYWCEIRRLPDNKGQVRT